MDVSEKKFNITKIYCEKCDMVFNSKSDYEIHTDKHSGIISCEACPLDTAIQKFLSFFRRKE